MLRKVREFRRVLSAIALAVAAVACGSSGPSGPTSPGPVALDMNGGTWRGRASIAAEGVSRQHALTGTFQQNGKEVTGALSSSDGSFSVRVDAILSRMSEPADVTGLVTIRISSSAPGPGCEASGALTGRTTNASVAWAAPSLTHQACPGPLANLELTLTR